MNSYDHKAIEAKWQKQWADANLFRTPENPEDKMYLLVEFPYPSGNLHVGHWYAFAVTDIFARYMHHIGKDVLFPIGFDAFGLPAENAAIKRGLNPKTWTYSNIEYMEGQLRSMGTMFDWERKVATCDPEYYRWTQWLFLQFYKNNLVHHENTHVNWCPSCKTVLANEQLEGGVCERCGSAVEQKEMKQWNIQITKYADRLIDDLDEVQWPEYIKEAQKNWIGRSTGTYFEFPISGIEENIKVFTTRPDTFYGVTYVVVAPEHELVQQLKPQITNWDQVEEYIQKTNKKTDLERQASKEKSGVRLEGIMVTHPATKEEIPVFISDYVLAQYGTGAVMAVPAHDERDYEFAQKFGLPITHVIMPVRVDRRNPPQEGKKDVARKMIHALVRNPKDDTFLTLKWKNHDWHTFVVGGIEEQEDMVEAAKREVLEETGYTDLALARILGEPVQAKYFAAHKDENRTAYVTALVFDLQSDARQPISEEEEREHDVEWRTLDSVKKGPFTCAELDIWMSRIENEDTVVTEAGILTHSQDFDGLTSDEAKAKITERFGEKATTYKLQDWSVSRQRYWGCPIPMVHCQACGTVPVPEDQLPVELPDIEKIEMRDDGKSPLAHNEEWVTTTCPACGGPAQRETDTLDTFVDSSWYYTRYADSKNESEIASKVSLDTWMPIDFYSGGSEHTTRHLLYARFVYKAMYDFGIVPQSEPFIKRNNRGLILGPDGEKMSKSKGNVVDPDEVVERVGSDVVRSYLAFMGPYGEAGTYPWDPNGVVGIRRFLERVYALKDKVAANDSGEALLALNTMLSQIRIDFEQLKFNTGLSKLMICANTLEKHEFSKQTYAQFLVVLNCYAPHICQELWEQIGRGGFIHAEAFPVADASILAHQMVKIAVQIDGKTRAVLEVEPGSAKEQVIEQAKSLPDVSKWLEGREIAKEVYVENRLLSIVTKG